MEPPAGHIPADGTKQCLRCGHDFSTNPADREGVFAICNLCGPPPPIWQTTNGTISLREASLRFETRDESLDAAMGTAAEPRRVLEATPKYDEAFVAYGRPGEHIEARLGPAKVRFNVKFGTEGTKASVEAFVELNNWHTPRAQLEDRLIWIDRLRDEHIEVYTIAGTAIITWTSGWGRISDHRHDSPRVRATEIPDIALPIMRPRQPARFAATYFEAEA